MNTYERGSVEIVRVVVRKKGVIQNTNVFFCILLPTKLPTDSDWIPAIFTEDGETGIIIDGLARGTYMVWSRAIDEPEDAMDRSGLIRIL